MDDWIMSICLAQNNRIRWFVHKVMPHDHSCRNRNTAIRIYISDAIHPKGIIGKCNDL